MAVALLKRILKLAGSLVFKYFDNQYILFSDNIPDDSYVIFL